MSFTANAVTTLTWISGENPGDDLLLVSQWHYFWHLNDSSGATRPDGSSGNAWAGVPEDGAQDETAEGSLYNILQTKPLSSMEYELSFNGSGNTDVDFSVSSAYYFNGITQSSNPLASLTINFGSEGSLNSWYQTRINTNALTFSVSLTEEQQSSYASTGVYQRVLIDSIGTNGYNEVAITRANETHFQFDGLDTTGLSNKGIVTNADEITAGSYGLLLNGTQAILIAKSVPEPATAALSLLALAGLAARRRRK